MGKINGCLKCIFVFFNILFMILGCILIFFAVKATALSFQVSNFGVPAIGWIWVFAIGIFGVSALGIFAACSEKALLLKIFAGFMGIGMIIMMIFGIIIAVQRNKMKNTFLNSEEARAFLKQDGAPETFDAIQKTFQCCGLTSAEDWGGAIPASCECSTSSDSYGFSSGRCKAKPQGTSGPLRIYEQSCGELFFSFLDLFFKIGLGFFFGFAVTALLGLLVSLFMIHQVKDNDTGRSIAMKGY